MRYFFHISYTGTHYHGWQKQPQVISVQEVIEDRLSKILKTQTKIYGCGRTDAGVHASQFFFHVDIDIIIDFDLVFRLNKILPPFIAVFDIIPMDGLPHARFDAIQRTYDYFIHTYNNPFLNQISALYQYHSLDFEKMKNAVALLPLYNDYKAFCSHPEKYEHTICQVSKASLFVSFNGSQLKFHISSNRFLGKMIRIIMGRLLKIGIGALSVDEFESYLINKTSPPITPPAHPQGLYLSKVTYPYLDVPAKTNLSNIIQDLKQDY